MDGIVKTASIVFVEDNPADVLLIKKALQEKDIKCALTCFEDGEKALKICRKRDAWHLISFCST